MQNFRKQLAEFKKVYKERKPPTDDGKYRLPDRRLLVKKEDKYTLIGHRDKKKQRELMRLSADELIGQILVKGLGKHNREKLIKLGKGDLVRLLYPRPRQQFMQSWLDSDSPLAKRIRTLMLDAVKTS